MDSNFEKVKEFNRAFDVKIPTTPQNQIFTSDPALVRLKVDLITEEVDELVDAVKRHDLVETADALADILYVVYGAGIAFGLDLDRAFHLVHQSNMSKLCRSESEAIDTVEWYRSRHERGLSPYDSPAYRESTQPGFFIVYNKSTGKILKNIHYQPVDLREIAE